MSRQLDVGLGQVLQAEPCHARGSAGPRPLEGHPALAARVVAIPRVPPRARSGGFPAGPAPRQGVARLHVVAVHTQDIPGHAGQGCDAGIVEWRIVARRCLSLVTRVTSTLLAWGPEGVCVRGTPQEPTSRPRPWGVVIFPAPESRAVSGARCLGPLSPRRTRTRPCARPSGFGTRSGGPRRPGRPVSARARRLRGGCVGCAVMPPRAARTPVPARGLRNALRHGIKPANLSVPARWNGRSGRS